MLCAVRPVHMSCLRFMDASAFPRAFDRENVSVSEGETDAETVARSCTDEIATSLISSRA